jgi:hypothetical protein
MLASAKRPSQWHNRAIQAAFAVQLTIVQPTNYLDLFKAASCS